MATEPPLSGHPVRADTARADTVSADTVRADTRSIAGLLQRHSASILLLFCGVLAPLWLFVALADEIHEMEAFVFDGPLLLRAHGLASPARDLAAVWVSWAGYQGVILADIALVLVLLARRYWREATFAAGAVAGSSLLNLGAKHLFQRTRPSLWESIAPETTYSFPSGHAMGSMTFALVLVALAWPTRWRWPVTLAALLFAFAVALSRVYLGVHYPSDLLGGWAAASAWVIGLRIALFHSRRPFAPAPTV